MTGIPIYTLEPGDLFCVLVDKARAKKRNHIANQISYVRRKTKRVGMRIEDADGNSMGRARVPIVWMDCGMLATLDRDVIVWAESDQAAEIKQ